ncbi:hypothetical protein llap_3232 [Limosa lapponica baueri]|uniref:Uncharacterized protein n=1 Tax=Limosa lapponica baueri TaxID=1758121 RepID=A0A2I0UK90_LIMLA|nr:hypothetical protein llap_3232 [Limosa lapponica baueri]
MLPSEMPLHHCVAALDTGFVLTDILARIWIYESGDMTNPPRSCSHMAVGTAVTFLCQMEWRAMHFVSAILYLWIIFESLHSPPGHSHRSSPCKTYSRQSSPTGDRTIRQPLTAKWGQDKGPGNNPLALSSQWIDEGAAAPPGRTWKTGNFRPQRFSPEEILAIDLGIDIAK